MYLLKFHRVYLETCRKIHCDRDEIIRDSHMITCMSYVHVYADFTS